MQLRHSITRIGEIPIYALDSLVRRAEAIASTQTIMEGECSYSAYYILKRQQKFGIDRGR